MLDPFMESAYLPTLQSILFRSWLAKLEEPLAGLLPVRQPNCLVAIENRKVIGFAILHPYNRRGSCWSIALPDLQVSQNHCISIRTLLHTLLRNAIQLDKKNSQSWLIRCPADDSELLSIVRELGFQPLKLFQCWASPNQQISKTKLNEYDLIQKELSWLSINRDTAPLLWALEHSGNSSYQRQIVNRQWIDLLDQKHKNTGVLVTNNTSKPT